jgi:phosphohistidine phosphatase
MELYLIRHADALPVGHDGVADDEERPLSDEGRAQGRALGAALQRQGVRFDVVAVSPLVRARQTAEALLEGWPAPAPEVVPCDHLGPGGKRKRLTRFLRGLQGESIALVGHNPDLSVYAGWLIGDKKVQLELAKAGVARIDFDSVPGKNNGVLAWMVTPEWCGFAQPARK